MHITSVFDDHGDSLHQPPTDDILGIISWVITGLGHPPVEIICEGTISRQGGLNGGEWSCGIATLNFIECYSNDDLCQWEGSNSYLFQNLALQNLICYHNSTSDWVQNFHIMV